MSRSKKAIRSCSPTLPRKASRRLRRVLLASLVAGSSLLSFATPVRAGDHSNDRRGGISILVHEFSAEANGNKSSITKIETAKVQPKAAPQTDTQVVPETPLQAETLVLQNEFDLASTCGTHDTAIASAAKNDRPAARIATRTSSEFDRVIAAAVTASASRLGISLEQVLEPFAMVGPIVRSTPPTSSVDQATDRQLAEAVALNRWWLDDVSVPHCYPDVTIAKAEVVEVVEVADMAEIAESLIPNDAIADAIAKLAGEEPLDVSKPKTDQADALIGSAPVIVTIQDAYMPYDLARRDLEWKFSQITTVVPFKPQNYVLRPDSESVAAEPESKPAELVAAVCELKHASPECVLDELIYDATAFAERARLTDLTFASLGESLGDWIGEIVAIKKATANTLANHLPIGLPDDLPAGSNERKNSAECEVATSQAVVATMLIDGEVVPAPVADPLPNAQSEEQVAASETAEPTIDAAASVERERAAETITEQSQPLGSVAIARDSDANDTKTEALTVNETKPEVDAEEEVALAKIIVEQVAVVVPADKVETKSAEMVSTESTIPQWSEIAKLIATIDQWQQQTIASLLEPKTDVAIASIAPPNSNDAFETSLDDAVAEGASEQIAERLEASNKTILR